MGATSKICRFCDAEIKSQYSHKKCIYFDKVYIEKDIPIVERFNKYPEIKKFIDDQVDNNFEFHNMFDMMNEVVDIYHKLFGVDDEFCDFLPPYIHKMKGNKVVGICYIQLHFMWRRMYSWYVRNEGYLNINLYDFSRIDFSVTKKKHSPNLNHIKYEKSTIANLKIRFAMKIMKDVLFKNRYKSDKSRLFFINRIDKHVCIYDELLELESVIGTDKKIISNI